VTANIRLEWICSVGCHSPGIRRGQPSPPSGGWLLDTYPKGTYSAPTRNTTCLLESTQREQFVDLILRLARHTGYFACLAGFDCKTYMLG
jgi:hypothetical protein